MIGVGGGTGSGKTALARALRERYPDAAIIELDAYYRDHGELTEAQRNRLNYDQPRAIDVKLLLQHLRRLISGEAVPVPVYSFASHTRIGTRCLAPARVVVVEGLFALWWKSLRRLCDLKVYIEVAPDLRLARRIRRDIVERGRPIESVLAQYLETVRPMHERFVAPTSHYADLVVENDRHLDQCVERVLRALIRTGAGGPAGPRRATTRPGRSAPAASSRRRP